MARAAEMLAAWSRIAAMVLGALILAACAQQPGGIPTGGRTGPAERDAAFLSYFGGPYSDARLQAYVTAIGSRLAAQTGSSGISWKFTVVDSAYPTGGASPDGNVFITRGMLSLVADESEVAAVFAHEIGHIVLRHHANRVERQRRELTPVVQAVEHGNVTEARRLLVEGLLRIQAYSRENEFEADHYAVQLLAKAQYPSNGVGRMLARLHDLSAYTDRDRLSEPTERESLLASHPAIAERVARAESDARALPGGNRDPATREFLDAIEGMIVGRDMRNGVARDGQILHGVYGLRLKVPDGYFAFSDRQLSGVLGRDGSGYIFNCQPESVSGSMQSWLQKRMPSTSGNAPTVDAFPMDNFDAASISATSRFRNGNGRVKLVTVRKDELVCRFLMLLPPEIIDQTGPKLDASIRSMARLSDAEQASLRPFRMRIRTANGGETLEALARSQALPNNGIEFLRLLNGVEAGHHFASGQSIKMLSRD